ncbi:hypothetical protein HQQ94_20095 [Shewanella sp. VB17]|nr:hypothetical protein [Shewanella sp. VB17]NRD75477.1 hypothetical protein [Shewanella sp. VB17]
MPKFNPDVIIIRLFGPELIVTDAANIIILVQIVLNLHGYCCILFA